MRIVLRDDVDNLGKKGDLVDVADGYARNFLLPKGHAFTATDGAVSQAGAMRRARDLRDAHEREGAQAIATKLVAKVITIAAKSGPDGKLYGSVTSADVATAIEAQTGISLERKQLHMDPLKSLGEHSVSAKLHSAVEFPIRIEVVKR
jgi:large subunit ribosomal protein L9